MPYHLVYFNFRGRGEPVKWVMKAANIDYTEETIDVMKEWVNRRKEYDWKKTPVIIIDGRQQLHHTTLICRYLADKHNFVSKDHWTAIKQQEVAEGVHDLTFQVADVLWSRARKEEARQKQSAAKVRQRVPEVYDNIEKALSPAGWIFSDKMTWVDVFVACYMDILDSYFPGTSDGFPKCQELKKRVMNLPQIKKWIDTRPDWIPFENPVGLE